MMSELATFCGNKATYFTCSSLVFLQNSGRTSYSVSALSCLIIITGQAPTVPISESCMIQVFVTVLIRHASLLCISFSSRSRSDFQETSIWT